ncbi:putative bifunctional diguanylate cyclase/phosphodiesterase [Noviherbaspirillum aerium]|uniref:putative bifunctional diguanylate cyclase/phosphodiesterase n=1 Tax=Noviherbaspirillum aerium TaxID=2588497 RepID=UPI00178C59F4|nr:EAL domain-containing protein [Noviherbaspirillum aerium]
MDKKCIHVLLIEDNSGDARLISLMLAAAGNMVFQLTWHDTLNSGLNYLRNNQVDVLLLDLGLPESSGLQTMALVRAQLTSMPPLVVLSGLSDEAVALQAVQLGAQDYLIKGHVDSALLARSIRYAMERSRAEESLRQAHAELENRVQERTAELANAFAALKSEIAERKLAEENVLYLAHHDALTGLPNRVLLQDRLRQAIAHARRNTSQVAVLFIDLDNFKHINDSFGHHMGDRLLKAVAARLQGCLRECDSLARFGGDEFVLCLPKLPGNTSVTSVAQKIQEALVVPFDVDACQMHVSASIGISTYPQDGVTVDALMRAADTAMYHAKSNGRRNYQFFTAALNDAVQRRVELEQRLRFALAHDELELHYQPQVDLAHGVIFSAEALLRWRQPGKNPISCGPFIAIAEETGLILSIGEWTLRQACSELKRWHEAGHIGMHVAVNLSPRQFYQPGFHEIIKTIIVEAGVPPTHVDLEITEGVFLERNDDNLTALQALSEFGIQLAVDDFGTGYSSLAYLMLFPVNTVKIDQSFVRKINTDQNATALVAAIISMAHSLGLKVLAEGVETVEQVSFLQAHGCSSAQGFFYSKAVSSNDFELLLNNRGYCIDVSQIRPYQDNHIP